MGISALILTGIGLVYPAGWAFVFTTMLSYVIFDFIIGTVVTRVRGSNTFVIPVLGHRFQRTGYAYLAFLFGGIITISTLASVFSQSLAELTKTNLLGVAVLNLVACALVYLDLVFRA